MYQPLFINSKRNLLLNASSEAIYFRNKHYQLKKIATNYVLRNEAPKRLLGDIKWTLESFTQTMELSQI